MTLDRLVSELQRSVVGMRVVPMRTVFERFPRMTGYAESAASGEFLETGMQIISKPFTMDKLAAKIREMIDNSFDLAPR